MVIRWTVEEVSQSSGQVTLVYLVMALKFKSSDAGNSDLPKISHKVFPLSEKVKVFNLIRRKNQTLRLLKSAIRMNLLSMKSRRREKKFMLALLAHLKLQKLAIMVCNKHLVTMEKY